MPLVYVYVETGFDIALLVINNHNLRNKSIVMPLLLYHFSTVQIPPTVHAPLTLTLELFNLSCYHVLS